MAFSTLGLNIWVGCSIIVVQHTLQFNSFLDSTVKPLGYRGAPILDSILELPPFPGVDLSISFYEVEEAGKGFKNGNAPGADVIQQRFSSMVVITYISSSTVHGDCRDCPGNRRTPILSQYSRVKETDYRGIFLLFVTGKILAWVMLRRLLQHVFDGNNNNNNNSKNDYFYSAVTWRKAVTRAHTMTTRW